MRFSTTTFAILALSLASQALGCLNFHAHMGAAQHGVQGIIVTLTDNGGVKCTYGLQSESREGVIVLDCIPGYYGTLDLGRGNVFYSQPQFSGSFNTHMNTVGGVKSYDADVWGC